MKIIKFKEYSKINENHTEKYSELKDISTKLANEVLGKINIAAENVNSEMPYKSQYILEELIKILQESV